MTDAELMIRELMKLVLEGKIRSVEVNMPVNGMVDILVKPIQPITYVYLQVIPVTK
jgi:hypothetical protein